MPGPYDVGDLVRITGTFTDINGVVTDPTSVFFKYKDPSNVTTTYTYGVSGITKSSTGVYYVDLNITLSGAYYYRFYSTGTGQAAAESSLSVRASNT